MRTAFIICLRDGLFLHSYSDEGVFVIADLQKAKLFTAPPISVADVFHGAVLTVLANSDGSGVRRTLLDRATTGPPKTPSKVESSHKQFTAAKQ